tara:strand:- start:74 stop:397 length:324 start_codon:yes stop_codon:yes gene_type:complete
MIPHKINHTLESRAHFVTYRATRLNTDGNMEIGVYVDPILPGAATIMTSVITRPLTGARWRLHTAGGRTHLYTNLTAVRRAAWDHAAETDAGKMHMEKYFPKNEENL